MSTVPLWTGLVYSNKFVEKKEAERRVSFGRTLLMDPVRRCFFDSSTELPVPGRSVVPGWFPWMKRPL